MTTNHFGSNELRTRDAEVVGVSVEQLSIVAHFAHLGITQVLAGSDEFYTWD